MTAVSTPPTSEISFPLLSEHDLRPALATARRILGCDHLAHDAVQEALLAMSQLDFVPDRPAAWVTQAVVHRSRHLRRTLRRRQHHEHVASQHCRLHGDCDNPLHVAIAHELGERYDTTLGSLPPEQREVYELYESGGLSYEELAERLDVPIGTVRSRLARARRMLLDSVGG